MKKKVYFFIVDAYPVFGSAYYNITPGATISIWISFDAAKRYQDALVLLEKMICTDWKLVAIRDRYTVGDDDYINSNEGFELYEQSLKDGFVAHIHHTPREVISLSGVEKLLNIPELKELILDAEAPIFCLYSSKKSVLLEAISPLGTPYLPIWTKLEEAEKWGFWGGGCFAKKINSKPLYLSINKMNRNLGWVGVGHKDCIVMFHPKEIQLNLRINSISPH